MLVTSGTVSTSGSRTTVWLYSSAQYSVHLFRMLLVSIRQFPTLSCMVLVFPCSVLVKVFTSWYAFLLLFFLMLSSTSWHCTSIQDSFALFKLFVISWLIALYFLAPSVVSCLWFFSALRWSHRLSMSVVTYGILTALRLPKISLAVSVIASFKVLRSVSTSVSSAPSKVKGANLPPIITRTASEIWGSLSFSRLNLTLVGPCIFIFFKRSQKDIITKSWSCTSYVSSWEASCLISVVVMHFLCQLLGSFLSYQCGHEVPNNHDIINLVMVHVSSIWAVPSPSSGYFVFGKCIRQHKNVVARETPEALDFSHLSLGYSSIPKCLSSSWMHPLLLWHSNHLTQQGCLS